MLKGSAVERRAGVARMLGGYVLDHRRVEHRPVYVRGCADGAGVGGEMDVVRRARVAVDQGLRELRLNEVFADLEKLRLVDGDHDDIRVVGVVTQRSPYAIHFDRVVETARAAGSRGRWAAICWLRDIRVPVLRRNAANSESLSAIGSHVIGGEGSRLPRAFEDV